MAAPSSLPRACPPPLDHPPHSRPEFARERRLLNRLVALAVLVWTGAVGGSLYLNVRLHSDTADAMAHHKAVDSFNKDLALRIWASGKGGIYLEQGDETPPLAELAFLPDRDLTAGGKQLTLYDPASMLRNLNHQVGDLYGIPGRIVGLHPFNPANAPDAWERKALAAFQAGAREVMEVVEDDGREYLRLMRPMRMLGNCLKCHAHQGYEPGVVQAGIGVVVPLDEFRAAATAANRVSALSHGGFWLLGLVGIGVARQRVSRQIGERNATLAELELSARVFEDGLQAIMITDAQGHILRVNGMFTELTGYVADEVVGFTPARLRSDHHPGEFFDEMWRQLRETGRWTGEVWNRRKSGELFASWESISALRDAQGRTYGYIAMFQDVTDQKASSERIFQLAHYDPLTRLPNRQLFADRVEHAILRAAQGQGQHALLFIDLDQFKRINDTAGHYSGDRLLMEVARRLQTCLRANDTVGRLGGDEFAVLMEDVADPLEVERVSERILTALAQPVRLDGRDWYIGASIGISLHPRDGDDLETLLKNADTAMYRAKSEGRNRFRFFNSAMAEQAALAVARDTALRLALENRGFTLHFQPQICLSSHRIVGVEALLRWPRADGLVSPAEFIPWAEESGLIIPIGRWVLTTACAQIADLRRRLGHPLRLAVNISAVELSQPDFLDQVDAALAAAGLPPEALELEITESAAMTDIQHGRTLFDTLAGRGIALAIDDFGTGHSSLAYLKQLPVDCLKIDRSFVRDTPGDREDCAIVRTIISMSRTLNLRVVAEGVETREQLDFLRDEGCDVVQGWYFARPLPLAELEQRLRDEDRRQGAAGELV